MELENTFYKARQIYKNISLRYFCFRWQSTCCLVVI